MIIRAMIKCAACNGANFVDFDLTAGDEQTIEINCKHCYRGLVITRIVEYVIKFESKVYPDRFN